MVIFHSNYYHHLLLYYTLRHEDDNVKGIINYYANQMTLDEFNELKKGWETLEPSANVPDRHMIVIYDLILFSPFSQRMALAAMNH